VVALQRPIHANEPADNKSKPTESATACLSILVRWRQVLDQALLVVNGTPRLAGGIENAILL
jgi:hypothetical protein